MGISLEEALEFIRLRKENNILYAKLNEHEEKEAQFLKDYGVTLDSYLANLPTSEDDAAVAERDEI